MASNLYATQLNPGPQQAVVGRVGMAESVYLQVQAILGGPDPRMRMAASPGGSPAPGMGHGPGMDAQRQPGLIETAVKDPRVIEAAKLMGAALANAGMVGAAALVPGGIAGKYMAHLAIREIRERFGEHLGPDQNQRQTPSPRMDVGFSPRMR